MAIEDAAWTEARAAAAPFVNRQLKEIKEADSTMNDLDFCNIDIQIWGSGHKVICEEIAKYLNKRFNSTKW